MCFYKIYLLIVNNCCNFAKSCVQTPFKGSSNCKV